MLQALLWKHLSGDRAYGITSTYIIHNKHTFVGGSPGYSQPL